MIPCWIVKGHGDDLAPIIILGPGRSGSTLLYWSLARHPELAYPSNWTARLGLPQFAFLSRLNDIPWLEIRMRGFGNWPSPSESSAFWNRFVPNFASTDVGARDIEPSGERALIDCIHAHTRWQGKPRFIAKITGWPRLSLLRKVFPNAYFVYLERDPRAVVYSFYQKGWRWDDYRFDSDPPPSRSELLTYYAERYKKYHGALRNHPADDFLRIHYEDLVQNMAEMLELVCDYTDLICTEDAMKRMLPTRVDPSPIRGYREHLTKSELDLLEDLLLEPLEELGYSHHDDVSDR